MSPIDLTSGVLARPTKLLIYGVAGLGKTTLAARLTKLGKKVVFIDTEQGTLHVDVQRVFVNTKAKLDAVIKWLRDEPHEFDTVTIDTITGLESVMENVVLANKKKDRMADFDFGKGSVYLREEFERFLFGPLDELVARGLNVILIGHSQIQRMQLPELVEGFDRYELAMDKKVSASIRQWCDHVLFGNWDYKVTENERRETRGIAGKGRILHAQHSAAFDAKNRAGLPEKLEWKVEALAPLFESVPAPQNAQSDPQALWEELVRAMAARRVEGPLLWNFLQNRFPRLKDFEESQLLPVEFLGRVIPLEYVQRALAKPDAFAKAIAQHEPLPA
jgi:hypothetical protein